MRRHLPRSYESGALCSRVPAGRADDDFVVAVAAWTLARARVKVGLRLGTAEQSQHGTTRTARCWS